MNDAASALRQTDEAELHDLVCVGFGPASLAIAVALHDAIEASGADGLSSLGGRPPKVAFLEKQPRFAWHSGMLLEGAKMQITFLKDMATMRNPRSKFTFINYLHSNQRLVEFMNMDTFLPARIEYEDYMRWCANHFEDVVNYDSEVLSVVPEKTTVDSIAIDSFVIKSRNNATGDVSTRRARNVVIATGGRPNIPAVFPQQHPRVLHSSQYATVARKIMSNRDAPYKVAVIGGGQSAAEIFNDIQEHYPNSQTKLLIRGPHLRPSDDSPFVNEVFNPSRVDDVFSRDPSVRSSSLLADKATNYGVVRLTLLEKLYEGMYLQKLKYGPNSEAQWPHRILPHRNVASVTDSPVLENGLRLRVQNKSGEYFAAKAETEELLDVDLVLVASGYRRDAHEDILAGCRWLMPGGEQEGRKWEVRRDYGVQLEEGKVSPGTGIWLQGCNEMTHGLSDTLLSILAVRGAELVGSIFAEEGN
ncbi:L-ornithine 5-monooxygenase (L-ornithine N(5)-oxygenase) [Saccharata proteae CBS 121410]|uniref:L-ornithine N(5)-monooxygenase [NAD(P)H] n=1 Tax=Saccharata proteae CBS 121410 TaxID=1314787 RepID=A0A9P4LV20_9PEZI|nr:L-ornithine 5-monooxygenase (L-ornithine N(5)-oxygenase) [Saccharata proteae CBS 121410]